MKIVFDTNVLISGFLTTAGPSEHTLKQAFKKHTVILSGYILLEFEKTLTQKLKVPVDLAKRAKEFLRKRALTIEVARNPEIRFSDRKDIPILNLIWASKPHYFVTGDKRLLAMKKLGPTLFLSPREAMELL